MKVPIVSISFLKKNFPSFTAPSFKRFRFSPNVIVYAIALYFEGSSSLRQVQRFLQNHMSVCVSHISIYRWIRHFAPFFRTVFRFLLQKANLQSDEWHIDETFIKVKGQQHYLWVLLDSETRVVIAFRLSSVRDSNNALALLKQSRSITDASPFTIITDGLDAYNMPVAIAYPNSKHYKYDSFTDDCSNNVLESFNKTFKAWYQTKKGFRSFDSAVDMISNFLFYYNFIHSHSSLSGQSPACVAGVSYSKEQANHWFLF